MIFISKNEDGIPAWKLILGGSKTITRRIKPIESGKIRAVQPGRTKKGIAHIEIIDCTPHSEWWNNMLNTECFTEDDLQREAKAEGFNSWGGLLSWFNSHKININDTYRLEFKLVDDKNVSM